MGEDGFDKDWNWGLDDLSEISFFVLKGQNLSRESDHQEFDAPCQDSSGSEMPGGGSCPEPPHIRLANHKVHHPPE